MQLKLGDACTSLLGYDGHLIAVSRKGVIELADPLRLKSLCRFQVQGPVTAEPCINDGVLYVATRGQLAAYSLAAMTLGTPRVSQLWQLPLSGPPLHALTAAGDRLFVTVATSGQQAVYVVDSIGHQPSAPRQILGARTVSWMTADPASGQAIAFTESDGYGVQLHVIGAQVASYPVQLAQMANHAISLLGGTVFAVFGESRSLYRIDAGSGAVVEPLENDTQHFALSHAGDNDWDRDGVHIDTLGVTFLRSGVRDGFVTHERAAKGAPVLVQESAAIVGMEDGHVRIYNLAHAPRHESWSVGGSPITALAAFESYVVAGNSDGVVDVRELRGKGAA
jgi:hypothetical protein